MQVTNLDLDSVARYVFELCGIVLDRSKGYLIESRLADLVKSTGCNSYAELCQKARWSKDKVLEDRIIDAITTQETLFFRDTAPFEALAFRILPDAIDTKARTPYPRRLRFWSAACSTGQEPYSIAMTLFDQIPDILKWDVTILATDISDSAIATASRGVYARHEIARGTKPEHLAKYFDQAPNGWKIKDQVRSLVTFRRLNLLKPFPPIGPFDVIFCRNVAIYFDYPSRSDLFRRLARELTSIGSMFVGSSESLTDLGPQFTPRYHCRATFYQPNLLNGHGPATLASTMPSPRPVAAPAPLRPMTVVTPGAPTRTMPVGTPGASGPAAPARPMPAPVARPVPATAPRPAMPAAPASRPAPTAPIIRR